MIGRRLRPPSFMRLTGLRASTDRFNRPRRRHSDRELDARVISDFFFFAARNKSISFFCYRRSSVSLVSSLKFPRTVGVSPTLPRNPLLSGFPATLYLRRSPESRVYRANRKFAVLRFSI